MVEEIRKRTRIAVATGGFLLMMGLIMVGTCTLVLLNVLDVSVLVEEAHVPLLLTTLLLFVVLDAVATTILLCR